MRLVCWLLGCDSNAASDHFGLNLGDWVCPRCGTTGEGDDRPWLTGFAWLQRLLRVGRYAR